MKKSQIAILIIAIFVNIIIWTNSTLSGDSSGSISNSIATIISDFLNHLGINTNVINTEIFVRKTAHFSLFFLLTIFWFMFYRGIFNDINKTYLFTAIHLILTAIIDESIQGFIPNRTASIYDVMLDISGGITALLLITIFLRLRVNKKASTE